jgi:hypothetical protein
VVEKEQDQQVKVVLLLVDLVVVQWMAQVVVVEIPLL